MSVMDTTQEVSVRTRTKWPSPHFSTGPLWAAGGFVLLVAAWQAVVSAGAFATTTLPSPLSVWNALGTYHTTLISQGLTTLIEILLGFVFSALIGFAIALLISSSRVLSRLLYPQMIVAQAVPKLALVPIILVWFGFGSTSNAVIAVLISVFPMIVNTLHGFQSTDRRYVDLGRTMAGGTFTIFRRIKLPSAMPSIFTGLKLCMSFATVGAVAGEIFAGTSGLGFVVASAAGALNSPLAFAAIVVVSLIGLVFYYAMLWLERKLIPWAPSSLVASA